MTATDPSDGDLLRVLPTQITVDFSVPVLLSSLAPADLTVDALPATAITLVDIDTVVFDLPAGLPDGAHDVEIAAGAILDYQQRPIQPLSIQYAADATPPRVIRRPKNPTRSSSSSTPRRARSSSSVPR